MGEDEKQECSLAMDNMGFESDSGNELESDIPEDEIQNALVNDDMKTLMRLLENKKIGTLSKWLLEASNIGTVASVSWIIEKLKVTNKDVDLTSIWWNAGNTALHLAAESSSSNAKQIMELLLTEDPRLLERENVKRRTPLHTAAYGQLLNILFCKICN